MSANLWDLDTDDGIDASLHRRRTVATIGSSDVIMPDRSFLRWVGGKQHLIARLTPLLPSGVDRYEYVEPFAGAANLFFALKPNTATLSDLNEHLIECYRSVREKPKQVAAYLREHKRRDSQQYYYGIRDAYNGAKPSTAQAARFIYLNRTCFNGIFRVNTKGSFNVPYGFKKNPIIPGHKALAGASALLKRATLQILNYEEALQNIGKGSFAYVDPPYPPLNGTAYFTHYTANRFGSEDQERLAAALDRLDLRGGLFLLTNADIPAIRRLYRRYRILELSVKRSVSCKGQRKRMQELVITNY